MIVVINITIRELAALPSARPGDSMTESCRSLEAVYNNSNNSNSSNNNNNSNDDTNNSNDVDDDDDDVYV